MVPFVFQAFPSSGSHLAENLFPFGTRSNFTLFSTAFKKLCRFLTRCPYQKASIVAFFSKTAPFGSLHISSRNRYEIVFVFHLLKLSQVCRNKKIQVLALAALSNNN